MNFPPSSFRRTWEKERKRIVDTRTAVAAAEEGEGGGSEIIFPSPFLNVQDVEEGNTQDFRSDGGRGEGEATREKKGSGFRPKKKERERSS